MALPIWILDALHSEQRSIEKKFWRCVEAQEVVSTLQLVNTLDEQFLLEGILEETKPPVPPECKELHYFYMTPFRYGPYPYGSRFRRSGATPGVYYVSQEPNTAIIETAFHRLLFYADSPDTPFPNQASKHTTFEVPVNSDKGIVLTDKPFTDASDLWMHQTNYGPCQELEEASRSECIEIILYASVRDPNHNPNAAILCCQAFATKAPTQYQSWQILFNKAGMHAICESREIQFSIAPELWKIDERLRHLDWNLYQR